MDNNRNDANRLKQNIRKKITTTMVGALDSFEKGFGRLWGHEKEGDFTQQEDRFFQIWSEVREEILDRGNAEIGGANQEIDLHNVERQRYSIIFKNRSDNGRN
jgi:hypothetical protein